MQLLEQLGIDSDMQSDPLARADCRVAVISPYPRSGSKGDLNGPEDSALNYYTRRLVRLLQLEGCEVSVVSSCVQNDRTPWSDEGVRVIPTFTRGKPGAAFSILFAVLRTKARVVHLQHELFAYGGIFNAFTIPICVAGLRLMRRYVLTTIHGVIPLGAIDTEFIKSNKVAGGFAPAGLVRFVWRSLLRLVCMFSNVVHVHEEQHRDDLIQQYHVRTPIQVIPFGFSDEDTPPSKSDARKTLGLNDEDEVVLFFGYLAAYKGVSELIASLNAAFERRPRLKVILAGDVNARLRGLFEPELMLRRHDIDPKRVLRLGFVPEEMISTVFSAADVLILPYTMTMAGSGPMSLGLSYGVPILPSSVFKRALPGFPGMFQPVPVEIASAMCRFFEDRELRIAIEERCTKERGSRHWPALANRVRVIYSELGA